VPLVLAASLLPVAAYCSVGAVAPGREGTSREHRRDLDVWHVLMASSMTAMLLGALTRQLAVATLAVSAIGLCWGVLAVERGSRRSGGEVHLRLVVGAGAMAVMTLPLAAPAMASAGHGSGGMGSGGMGSGMAGYAPFPLPLVLLAGLVMVAAVRLPVVVRRSPSAVVRLDAGCDVVMAVAMAAMLLAVV